MSLVVGIDLGTTNSCVAVYQNGSVKIIESEEQDKTIPSVVYYEDNGQVVVGKEAVKRSVLNKQNGLYDSKRMIGIKYNDERLQISTKMYPFKVVSGQDGECEIVLTQNGEEVKLRPEHVSAEILNAMKKNAEKCLGQRVTNVVITVPAYFDNTQKEATKDAAEIAGFNVLKLITEPVAAALAFTHDVGVDRKKTILVYDLGGGTFDVSLITLSVDKEVDVIAISGDNFLGGRDFDQNLMVHLLNQFEEKYSSNVDENQMRRIKQRLEQERESVKKTLSQIDTAEIELFEVGSEEELQLEVSRDQFEEVNKDLFEKTIKILDKLLTEQKFDKKDIDEVILVGGSTRIPKIRHLVQEYFQGKELNKRVNPDEAVAIGAAIQAALLSDDPSQKCEDYVLHDVVPRSLGTEVSGDRMSFIIQKNEKIPCEAEKIYGTAYDAQTSVPVSVYEGEDESIKKNLLLGHFKIDNITPMRMGDVHIRVKFAIDADGILNVTAMESSKNMQKDLKIQLNNGRLSKKEIEDFSFNMMSRRVD